MGEREGAQVIRASLGPGERWGRGRERWGREREDSSPEVGKGSEKQTKDLLRTMESFKKG